MTLYIIRIAPGSFVRFSLSPDMAEGESMVERVPGPDRLLQEAERAFAWLRVRDWPGMYFTSPVMEAWAEEKRAGARVAKAASRRPRPKQQGLFQGVNP